MASSSSSASNAAANNVVNEAAATTVVALRTPAPAADPTAPPRAFKRARLTFASPPPSLSATTSTSPSPSPSPSPSAGKSAAAPRAPPPAGVRGITRTPSSSVKPAAGLLARSPTRFFVAGKTTPRLARGGMIRTPTRATPSSSSSVRSASRLASSSRSAGKASATPAARRGTPRTAATISNPQLEAMSRRLRDGRISSDQLAHNLSEIEKVATKRGDASATVTASHLQETSIFYSIVRNTSKFSEICNSAEVSNPLPTVDRFLRVYEDTAQWKNIAESSASAGLSAQYWLGGDRHVVHELRLPNATKPKSATETANLAKNLCGQMQRWLLSFVEDALAVDDKWKHNTDTATLVSQLNKIRDWLEQVEHQIGQEEQEWTMMMIELLKPRIGHSLRRLEAGIVAPSSRSRRSHRQ